MAKYRRRIQLIKPSLQLRLTMVFVGLGAFGLVLQILLFTSHLSQALAYMPDGGEVLASLMDQILFRVMLVSVSVILPLTFAVGIMTTFRIAGPLYRFEVYLRQVERGENHGPCRIRKRDQLQDLCAQINATVTALRSPAETGAGATPVSEPVPDPPAALSAGSALASPNEREGRQVA